MHGDHQLNTYLFGSISFGSFWQALAQLRALGPSWSIVPPLLVGIAGLVGALNAFLNDRHRRSMESTRLDAELKAAAEEAAARRRYLGLAFDQPDCFN